MSRVAGACPVLEIFLWFILEAVAVGMAEDFETARRRTITGIVRDKQTAVELDLKALSMPSGAKCKYTTAAEGGRFSQEVKLFPGKNLITARTATGLSETMAKLSVEKPNLRVELSWIGPNLGYVLQVNDANMQGAGENGETRFSFDRAEAGLYRIYVRYSPPVTGGGGGGGGGDPGTRLVLAIGNYDISLFPYVPSGPTSPYYNAFLGETYIYSWPQSLFSKPTLWQDDKISIWCLVDWDGKNQVKINLAPFPFSRTMEFYPLTYSRDCAGTAFIPQNGNTYAWNRAGLMDTLEINATTACITQKPWIAPGVLAAAAQIAKVKIYLNDKEIFEEAQFVPYLSEKRDLVWNIGTVVLHSGDQAGGYAVDGRRVDVAKQGELKGVSPRTPYVVTVLSGPHISGPVYLSVGDAVQFTAYGAINLGPNNEQAGREIIEKFISSDTAVGTVDALGVFIAKGPGYTQISCEGYSGDSIDVYVLKVDMIPDYDCDGTISDADQNRRAEDGAYYFWLNDDADINKHEGSNIPGAQTPDYADTIVNGVRDLNDWFPVLLDVGQTVDQIASEECSYWLCHEGGAVNILTDVTGTPLVLFDVACNAHVFDPEVAESAAAGRTRQVTASGVQLDALFMISALNGKGVVLLEGRSPTRDTGENLTLEVRAGTDGRLICRSKLFVSLDSVTGMYRQLNLRGVGGGIGGMSTYITDPPNLPDAVTAAKHIVYVHGYNINGTDALDEQSAVFKNLWWCGSRARFHAVSWFGDATQAPAIEETLNFYTNVANAFATAPYVSAYSQAIAQSGEVTVIAHSLGNMVASAAICLHGAPAANYFMLDAAVAQEAYRSATLMTHNMVNANWADYTDDSYPNRLFASEWHTNFDHPDARSALTMRGLFTDWGDTRVCNFYSSGEDILDNAPYDCADDWYEINISGLESLNYVWCAQEKLKGRIPDRVDLIKQPDWWPAWSDGPMSAPLSAVGAVESYINDWLTAFVNEAYPNKEGGWMVNKANLTQCYSVPVDCLGVPCYRRKTLKEIFDPMITMPWVLTRYPIFTLPAELTDTNAAAASTYAADNRLYLLAHVFPATSYAMGKNQIENESGIENWDMNDRANFLRHGWYEVSSSDKWKWTHSDFKNVALLYTQEVYSKMVTDGGLK